MIIPMVAMMAVLMFGVWAIAVTSGNGCVVGQHDFVRGMCVDCGKVKPT